MTNKFQEQTSNLHTVVFDPELSPGARNAVDVCLRIQPHEKVTIITDDASKGIAASIAREVARAGAPYRGWVLEELAPRPLQVMPRTILDDLETSRVSIFAVVAQPNELKTRMQMTEVVTRNKTRHAHMVNINKQIMVEGMRADFLKVDEISTRVWELARSAQHIKATTPAGTEVFAELNPKYRWMKTSGIISPEKWGNLPGGEVFTAPEHVEGTFVIDGVIGDYLCAKYGNLREQPLTIHIKDSRLREVFSNNKNLEDDFWKYTHTDENSDRVGEFAIGTNIEVREVIGNILQDEKIPGVHLAFGNPYSEHTGAPWFSSTHLDVVGTKFDIWVDDRQIMNKGEFVLDGKG
jgi:aminopeptidase